jgi:ubiquinone/menaquinone biosynthesis C-methylase UbiE
MKNSKGSVGNFFDEDSADYLKHQYTDGPDSFMSLRRERAARLIRIHLAPKLTESFRFLDAGCGPGILLPVLGRFPITYWGVDISEKMLELAQRQTQSSMRFRGHFLKSDVEHLPFEPESFEAAASLGVIEYLSDDDALLAELSRVTVAGGYVLIAVTNRYSYNLCLEKIVLWLRRGRATAKILGFLKAKLKRGEFKQRQFVIRRHSPTAFRRKLEEHGLKIVEAEFWGFNLLPYPFNFICGRRLNRFANYLYDTVSFKPVRSLGEGLLVLCQKSDSGPASRIE